MEIGWLFVIGFLLFRMEVEESVNIIMEIQALLASNKYHILAKIKFRSSGGSDVACDPPTSILRVHFVDV